MNRQAKNKEQHHPHNIVPNPLNTWFFYPAETPESSEYFKHQSINGQLGEIKDIVPLEVSHLTRSRLDSCADDLH